MALPIPQPWVEAIEGFTRYLRVGDAAATTIRARREQLQHMARRIGVGPWEVDAVTLLTYVADQNWMTETRRTRYACFRDFWRWGKRMGLTRCNAAKQLPKVKPSEPNPDPVTPIAYEASQRRAVRQGDERSAIMMRLAHDHGLRRAEIALGHSNDLRQDLLGWSLLVHGKGRKDRIVPLTPRMALELRALGPGWFFPGAIDGHLSPRRVGEILRDSIEGHWTGHKLRHSFGTNVDEATGDTMTTGKLLGHQNLSTVPRYVKPSDYRLRAAVYAAAGIEPPAYPERGLRAVI